MTTEVKNIRVPEYGRTQVDTWQLPESQLIADDEVVVKIFNAPLNHIDYYIIEGKLHFHNQFPFTAGLEAYGQITRVGKTLDDKLVNKKVLVGSAKGTFATHGIFSRKEVYVLDDDINAEAVTQNFLINPFTAAGLVTKAKDAKAQAIVYTAGGSHVAQWITIFARKNDIKTIAIVRNEDHTTELKSNGVDVILNSSLENFESLLHEAVDKFKATVVLDALSGSFGGYILERMPADSVLINYGTLERETLDGINLHAISNGKSIRGYVLDIDLIDREKHEDLEGLINKIYRDNKPPQVHTQEFYFEQVADAVQQFEGKQKRFVLKF